MRAINHAATGALIGTVATQPLLAVPLAFASHFVLDSLIQYGWRDAQPKVKMDGRKFNLVLAVDIGLCLVLGVWLLAIGAILPALCAVVATSPDAMWLGMYLQARRGQKVIRPTHWLARLHTKIQWFERPSGIFVELPYLICVILLLASKLK